MILNRNSVKTAFVIFLSVYILLFSGCSKKKKISGREFIPQEVFVQVVTDIYLIDGITNDMKYYRKFNPDDSIDIYSSIFEKYDVTGEMYKATLDEYSKYPPLLDKVYNEVLKQLNLLEDKIDNEDEEPKDAAAKKEEAKKIDGKNASKR